MVILIVRAGNVMKSVGAIVLGMACLFPLAAIGSKIGTPPTYLECGSIPGLQVEAELANRDFLVLYVTFIGKKPTNKQTEKALRECLAVAIKRDGSRDILSTPWFRKRAAATKYGDEQINPFGSRTYLSYTAATEKIDITKMKGGSK